MKNKQNEIKLTTAEEKFFAISSVISLILTICLFIYAFQRTGNIFLDVIFGAIQLAVVFMVINTCIVLVSLGLFYIGLFLKRIVCFVIGFLGIFYLNILELFRFIKSIFTGKQYKNLIEEVAEEIYSKKHQLLNVIIDEIDKYCYVYKSFAFEKLVNIFKEYLYINALDIINNKNFYYDYENKTINKKAVKRYVVLSLTSQIDNKLTSGEFHIYRGVLNEQGKELLKIYKMLLEDFIKLKIIDEDTQKPIDNAWLERNINSLLEDIKNIG